MDTVTITLPDVSDWTWWNWTLLGLVCNAIYGFVTHAISLPAIHRYNNGLDAHNRACPRSEHLKPLDNGMLFWVLVLRMTLQLPTRIVMLIVGILVWVACFLSSFKPCMNDPLRVAFGWYCNPKTLRKELG